MESYSEIKPLSVRPFRISKNEQKFLFPKSHCYGHFYPLSISKTLSFLVIMLLSTIQMLKITLFVEGFFHDIYARGRFVIIRNIIIWGKFPIRPYPLAEMYVYKHFVQSFLVVLCSLFFCENLNKSCDKMQEEPFQLSKVGEMFTHRHIFCFLSNLILAASAIATTQLCMINFI